MNFSRRDFAKLLGYFAVGSTLRANRYASAFPAADSSKGKFVLEPFNYRGVRLLEGMFKRQLDATRDLYFNIPNDALLMGFRRRAGLPSPGAELGGWYGSDTFNPFPQFLSGMARMSTAMDDQAMREKTLFLMHEWSKTIEPDGYFYYSRKPHLPHYIYDKTVGALCDIHEYCGDKDALVSLSRITDWASKNLDRSRYNCTPDRGAPEEWYTLSENLYRAYLLTGEAKYKTFAEVWHYDRYWNSFAEDRPHTPSFLHAYSHVNTLSSAAMAYTVSGDSKFLRTVTNAYDYLQNTQCYATGGYGAGESLCSADGSLGTTLETETCTFETPCGSWAGFKLSRYLMSFTGECRYGDWIERLAYNGIGSSLPVTPEGKTFYYSNYCLSGGTKEYNGTQWPCCSGTYPQIVADYHNVIYFHAAEALYVNLFVPSEVIWRHRDQEVTLRQETAYPESDSVSLIVNPSATLNFPLYIRVPGWVKDGVAVKINGVSAGVKSDPGRWMKIARTWNPGDKVDLKVPLQFRFSPIDTQHPKRVAVMRGPLVLVRKGLKSRFADFSEWKEDPGKPATFVTQTAAAAQFVPFYQMEKGKPYSMYFDLED